MKKTPKRQKNSKNLNPSTIWSKSAMQRLKSMKRWRLVKEIKERIKRRIFRIREPNQFKRKSSPKFWKSQFIRKLEIK